MLLTPFSPQVTELKKKQDAQAQLLRQKQKSDEASKRLQDEIQRIKTHKVGTPLWYSYLNTKALLVFSAINSISLIKVQLQQKIKQESEQFRQWKAAREKEVLQVITYY